MESVPRNAAAGDTLDPNIIASASVVGAAAVIAVLLRIVSRRLKGVELGPDDYTILLALIFALGIVANSLVCMHYGLGKHIDTLSDADVVKFTQTEWACQLQWAATIPIVKVSILLLYLRVFGHLRYIRIAAWVLIVFCIMWGIATVVTGVLQCLPIPRFWNGSIAGKCIDKRLFFIIVTGINVVTDVLVLALPLHATWRLQISTHQKLSISGIVLLGGFTCAVSIARWISMFDPPTTDPTYDLFFPYMWSVIEPCAGIVSACLPTLRPLVSRSVTGLRIHEGRGANSFAKSSDPKDTSYIKEIAVPVGNSEKYQMLVNMPSIQSLAEMEAARTRDKGESTLPYSPEEVSPIFARAELSASREIPRSYDYQAAAMAQNLM